MSEVRSPKQLLFERGRSARNLLNRALIVFILFIVLAPFVLILSYIVTAAVTEMARAGSQILASLVWREHREKAHGGSVYSPVNYTSDHSLVATLMPWTVEFLSAGVVILLWGLSPATTANLLARMGARPAKSEGAGGRAARSLATLSAGAGLDPPKLYIVQTSFPAVFSDATDVRHTLVAVTSGALQLLDDREVEALLAHELSHIAYRDCRLETMLASLATLTEYPARMFQPKSPDFYGKTCFTRNLALLEVVLSPLSLYIFFVSPLINGLIRAMVMRSRDFHADAEAALLTGDPEVLANALAKIGGVVKVVGASTVSSLPAHCSLSQRVERLIEKNGTFEFNGLEQAIAKGKQYAREHPGMGQDKPGLAGSPSPLASLTECGVTGRVCQLVSREATPLMDGPDRGAMVRRRLEPGALLVVFEGRGEMQQVNTAEGVFGYITRKVKLKAVEGILPQEVYDPEARTAIEEVLRREAQSARPGDSGTLGLGLTGRHLLIAVGFGAAVFAGTTVLLLVYAGH
jgi:Zn-dependent protease with chaperone function